MNKFFTIARGVLLVYLAEGIGSGEMALVLPTAVPEAPPRTETRSDLPKALEVSRYTALGKKSPFTLASATAEADFAKELVLGGYVRLEGEDYVMVANKTNNERILVGRKPSPSAQRMILVNLKKEPGDPSKILQAQIKKGSEMAWLIYGETSRVPPIVPIQPQPPIPALLAQPAGAQTPLGGNLGYPAGQRQPPGILPRKTRGSPITPPTGQK